MGQRDWYKKGTYNAICYVCGFKRKADEMKLRWDGVYVCKEDWEIRQPQDFVRGQPEEQSLPWTQPEGGDTFVAPPSTPLSGTVQTISGIFLNGVLKTLGVDYTINVVNAYSTQIVFTSIPASGQQMSWSGTWLDNASVLRTLTQFPIYTTNGYTATYTLYGVG